METQTILAIPKQEDKEMVLYLGTQFPSHAQVTGYFWKMGLQMWCAVGPYNQALCSRGLWIPSTPVTQTLCIFDISYSPEWRKWGTYFP